MVHSCKPTIVLVTTTENSLGCKETPKSSKSSGTNTAYQTKYRSCYGCGQLTVRTVDIHVNIYQTQIFSHSEQVTHPHHCCWYTVIITEFLPESAFDCNVLHLDFRGTHFQHHDFYSLYEKATITRKQGNEKAEVSSFTSMSLSRSTFPHAGCFT